VLSPSASTLSLDSSNNDSITPPSTEDTQDIASRISIDHHGSSNLSSNLAAATAADRMVCPICNEEMMTLLQLNRHLDDVHKEIEVQEQDEVKDWFKTQMIKAKKFQPLAVLNQKLKGLEVFESNQNQDVSYSSGRSTPTVRANSVDSGAARAATASPAPVAKVEQVVDPDDVVSKTHWQRRSGYDNCSDPTCGKRLGSTSTGVVNCRHCGKLFCEEHTMYQMKLSRSAQHEPVRGYWCRVCETCYKSREGYNDRHGLERNRLDDFKSVRRKKTDNMTMEVSRLEKRLTRLTQLLANPPEDVPQERVNKRWSLATWGHNDPRKALEQSVVSWQNDAEVARCPYCQQDFSQYTFRRHHCRTCGKVVCGDPATGCSTMLPLNVATSESLLYPLPQLSLITPANATTLTEKPPPQDTIALDIRLCKECNTTLFSQRDFEASLTSPAIDSFTRSYNNLLQFERGIRLLLPKFQKLLQALQDPDSPPTPTQLSDASRTRKRLMDSFTQFDTAARRIRDMPSNSPTQLKLQKAIYQNASQFLHLHMLPLKTLPKILKHATPTLPNGTSTTGKPNSLASIHYNSLHNRQNSSSNISLSTTTSRISELEAEEKSLRERLIVLEEQRFMVKEMMIHAKRERRWDEVGVLGGNVEDLSREIDEVGGVLEGVRGVVGGLYVGNGGGEGG
jgi:rabenosyn-5